MGVVPYENEKSDTDIDEEELVSKRATKKRKTSAAMPKDERVNLLISSLRSIHGEKYNALQYRLWAEMIDIGTHASQDTPPNVPINQSFSEKKQKGSCRYGNLRLENSNGVRYI